MVCVTVFGNILPFLCRNKEYTYTHFHINTGIPEDGYLAVEKYLWAHGGPGISQHCWYRQKYTQTTYLHS